MVDVEKLEGFEEVSIEEHEEKPEKEPTEVRERNRPDFRVVQPDRDQYGKTIYKPVGAMWKQISKQGNEFYVLKIGELRLLVFPNEK